jgi:hypothetical protein
LVLSLSLFFFFYHFYIYWFFTNEKPKALYLSFLIFYHLKRIHSALEILLSVIKHNYFKEVQYFENYLRSLDPLLEKS